MYKFFEGRRKPKPIESRRLSPEEQREIALLLEMVFYLKRP